MEHVFRDDFAPPNREGFVGRALFEGYRLPFDYAQSLLWLLVPDDQAPTLGTTVPLEVTKDGWVLHGALDGVPKRMLLDTCSMHSLVHAPGAAQRPVRRTLTAGEHESEAFELIELPLNGPNVDVILGANFFVGHRVLIDPSGGVLSIA